MSKRLLLLIPLMVLLVGCVDTGKVELFRTTTYPDGTIESLSATLQAPKYPQDVSTLALTTNGLTASLSSAQDVAKREKVIQAGKSKRLLYGACGLMIVLGAIALGLPNKLVSNKDAIIMILLGFAGVAVLVWVDSSAKLMGWILPIAVVGGGGYIGWQYFKGKSPLITN